MKRIMTSTLAVLFAVGTISGLHTAACSYSTGNGISVTVSATDAKSNTINKINEIEKLMKSETQSLCDELEKKKNEFSKLMKDNGTSALKRDELKAKFYSDNKYLFDKLDKIRKPYAEEIKKIHKNYIDSLI